MRDYPDNARRFAFFCCAALDVLPQIAQRTPVVLHAHDWHTALAPVFLRTYVSRANRYYDRLAAVLSVHNAGFQGHFPPETLSDLGIGPELYNVRCARVVRTDEFAEGRTGVLLISPPP